MSFSYDKFKKGKNILQNINMSVPESSIYGLLGPSGCGKTTLLKLILGLRSPNSGTIKVNGRKPLDPMNKIPGYGVGFQPQETALYGEFSIRETLKYFAKIYGMKSESFKTRLEFLINFLDLPDPDRRVLTLSGGQQRRVSLAVAIVHNPPFLILDEPTVGVDPLLREKIWGHLVEMSNNSNISILITTHYVEEARRAHIVALMRSGHLLVEQSPDYLMNYFKVDDLEDMFLRVCMAHDDKSGIQVMPKSFVGSSIKQQNKKNSQLEPRKEARPPAQDIKLDPNSCKRFCALTHKNYMRLTRQCLMLCFQILSPALSMFLFLLCIGDLPKDMAVAVYDGEIVEGPTLTNQCKFIGYGYEFLQYIDKDYITLTNYPTISAANDSVINGETFGALIINRDFSSHLCNRLTGSDLDRNKSTILYYGDLSDITTHTTISGELKKAQLKFIHKIVGQMEYMRSIQGQDSNITVPNPDSLKPILVVMDPPIYGSLDISFRDFMVPGMTIAVVFILAVGLTALSFVTEKREGVMERTLMAGVKIYEILIAQIFVQIFVLLLQILVVLLLVFIVFQTRNEGSIFLIVLIILMQGVVGMTYGLVISIIAPDEQSALIIAFGSFFPMLLLSGVFWPIEGMLYTFQWISYFTPQTMAVKSLRWVMFKGWGLTDAYISFGYITTTFWFVVLSAAAIILSSIFT